MACKYCGGTLFHGHQQEYHDVVVDENGNWEEDEGCYESDHSYGPYTCCGCGAEYERLSGQPSGKPRFFDMKESLLSMAEQLRGMSATSPQLLDMATTVLLPLMEAGVPENDALLLAMALYSNAFCGADYDARFSTFDFVDAIANCMPRMVKPKNVMEALYLGPNTFRELCLLIAEAKRASYSDELSLLHQKYGETKALLDKMHTQENMAIIEKERKAQEKNPHFPFPFT